MTLGTVYYNWQQHAPFPDPVYSRNSPNLMALKDETTRRWGLGFLGCYGVRPIRGGTAHSTHSYGGAIDLRYLEQIGRPRCLSELLPWLIDNSFELHISAIHDYIGCRIWHPGRGWKAQSPDPTGMGQAWAGWLHIETLPNPFWSDATPIAGRLAAPVPTPPPVKGKKMLYVTYWKNDPKGGVIVTDMLTWRYISDAQEVADLIGRGAVDQRNGAGLLLTSTLRANGPK